MRARSTRDRPARSRKRFFSTTCLPAFSVATPAQLRGPFGHTTCSDTCFPGASGRLALLASSVTSAVAGAAEPGRAGRPSGAKL